MNATLIFHEKFAVRTTEGREVLIELDLYKLPDPYDSTYPEGYRFSWIALDPNDAAQRVLFDCHPPKGPHLHIDMEKEGTPFKWTSLLDAQNFFI